MGGNRPVLQRSRRVRRLSGARDEADRHDLLDLGQRIRPADETGPSLPQHSQRVQASGTNSRYDRVQHWLAETGPEVVAATGIAGFSPQRNEFFSSSHHGPLKGIVFETHHQNITHKPSNERRGIQCSRSRRRESSPCSSFLELGIPPQTKSRSGKLGDDETRLQGPHRLVVDGRREQLPATSSDIKGTQLITAPPGNVFDKRKRHKTRDDHYDPNKRVKESAVQDQKGRKNPRRERKSRRRKISKKRGDDLMHEFTSRSVGQDRLTLRPSQTLGLFKNGKASSPVLRQGLPDLVFSEMDFLQRAKNQMNSGENQFRLRSQEKERRKSERAHNEISAYFEQTLNPVREGDACEQYCEPVDSHVDELVQVPAERGCRHYQSGRSLSTSPSIGPNRSALVEFSHSRGSHHERDSRTNEEVNGSTTYYTWSETINTPNPATGAQRSCSRVSTTPESIRRSLDDTGIFADTGIDRTKPRAYRATREPETDFRDDNRRATFDDKALPEQADEMPSLVRSDSLYDGDVDRGDVQQHVGSTDIGASTESTRNSSWNEHEFVERKAEEDKGNSSHASTVNNATSQLSRQVLAQRAYISQLQTIDNTKAACRAEDVTMAGYTQPESSTPHEVYPERGDNNKNVVEMVSRGPLSPPCTTDNAIEKVLYKTVQPQQAAQSPVLNSGDSCITSAAALGTAPRAAEADQPSTEATAETFATQAILHKDQELLHQKIPPKAEEMPLVTCRRTRVGPQVFAGLPTRGIGSDGVFNSSTTPSARFATAVIAPLYSQQIRDQTPTIPVIAPAGLNIFRGNLLDSYPASVTEHEIDQYDAGSGILLDNYSHQMHTRSDEIDVFNNVSPTTFGNEVDGHLTHQEKLPTESNDGRISDDLYEDGRVSSLFAADCGPETMANDDELVQQEQGDGEVDINLAGFWRPQRHY